MNERTCKIINKVMNEKFQQLKFQQFYRGIGVKYFGPVFGFYFLILVHFQTVIYIFLY